MGELIHKKGDMSRVNPEKTQFSLEAPSASIDESSLMRHRLPWISSGTKGERFECTTIDIERQVTAEGTHVPQAQSNPRTE
jgi:hypothetical protein